MAINPRGTNPPTVSPGPGLGFIARPQGSQLYTTHTSREMRAFAVTEVELDSVSLLNTGTTACFSIGSAFASISAGAFIQWIATTELPKAQLMLLKAGAFGPLLVAAIFFGLGYYMRRRRNSLWETIKSQSRSN